MRIILLASLLLSPLLLAAQQEGSVWYRDTLGGGQNVSGRIVLLGESRLGVETADGPVSIERGQIIRVVLQVHERRSAAALGIAGGLYLAVLIDVGTDPGERGGLFGNRPAFVLQREGVDRAFGTGSIGLLAGGVVGTFMNSLITGRKERYDVEQTRGERGDQRWRELIDRLQEDRSFWRISVAGGKLLGQPRGRLREHQYRLGPAAKNDLTFIGEWPGPGTFQWLRGIELTWSPDGALEFGAGAWDLSIGHEANAIFIDSATGSLNDPTGAVSTTVHAGGYGGVIAWTPVTLDRFDLRLAIGGGAAVLNDVESAAGVGPSVTERRQRTLPFAIFSAELSFEVHAGLFLGLRSDRALMPERRLDGSPFDLPADTVATDLSTSTLGFVLGYRF